MDPESVAERLSAQHHMPIDPKDPMVTLSIALVDMLQDHQLADREQLAGIMTEHFSRIERELKANRNDSALTQTLNDIDKALIKLQHDLHDNRKAARSETGLIALTLVACTMSVIAVFLLLEL